MICLILHFPRQWPFDYDTYTELVQKKLASQFDRPKYATPIRTIKNHRVDYVKEDEDRLDDDNFSVHATSTKNPTSKDR